MWNVVTVACLNVLAQQMSGGTEESHKKSQTQFSRSKAGMDAFQIQIRFSLWTVEKESRDRILFFVSKC